MLESYIGQFDAKWYYEKSIGKKLESQVKYLATNQYTDLVTL